MGQEINDITLAGHHVGKSKKSLQWHPALPNLSKFGANNTFLLVLELGARFCFVRIQFLAATSAHISKSNMIQPKHPYLTPLARHTSPSTFIFSYMKAHENRLTFTKKISGQTSLWVIAKSRATYWLWFSKSRGLKMPRGRD